MMDIPNFDTMAKLARDDPEQFEVLRQSLINTAIQQANPNMQPRLHAQQSHIDLIISRGKNPLHTTLLLSTELQRQLQRFAETLQHPNIRSSAPIATLLPHTKQTDKSSS